MPILQARPGQCQWWRDAWRRGHVLLDLTEIASVEAVDLEGRKEKKQMNIQWHTPGRPILLWWHLTDHCDVAIYRWYAWGIGVTSSTGVSRTSRVWLLHVHLLWATLTVPYWRWRET